MINYHPSLHRDVSGGIERLIVIEAKVYMFFMTPVPVAPLLSAFALLLWLTAFHCLSEAFAN